MKSKINFQLFSAYLDGSVLPLSINKNNNKNVYTMLVGKNATGKTRALGKILNSCLFSFEKSSTEDTGYYENLDSIGKVLQVIAVTNSRFDRFPQPTVPQVRSRTNSTAYHYLGLKYSTKLGNSSLSKCAAAFFKAKKDETLLSNLRIILEYVGYLPAVQLEFTRPFHKQDPKRAFYGMDAGKREVMLAIGGTQDFPEGTTQFPSDIPARLEYLENHIKDLNFNIDLKELHFGSHEFSSFVDAAEPLLDLGLIELKNIIFYDKITKDKIPFRLASSGQQCMLLMFLGLVSVLKNNSLVCMDEPEISLHPRWQTEFVKILQNISNSYHGCHFVIASHSPQIVAGLSSIDSYVVDMESREIHPAANYSKRSADFQLAEVFEEPGFKNEYLIRILLGYLSNLAKGGQLSKQDKQTLLHIGTIKSRLVENDPVKHLFDQVVTLANDE